MVSPNVSTSARATVRFYRPELDVLRFGAFLSVFLVHGPRFSTNVGGKLLWNRHVRAGAFGLCLFFLLSSYLITELLLRERERTSTVDLLAFYRRRILRIWPLYYLGVVLGIMLGFAQPLCRWNVQMLLELMFFAGWLGQALAGNPFGVLWSISVEELFYAVWPLFARQNWLFRASLLLIPAAVAASFYTGFSTWYNPLVHFLYFATGALLALVLRKYSVSFSAYGRWVLTGSGLLLWFLPTTPRLAPLWPLTYLLADLGCVALFLAVWGIDERWLPKGLLYLGKISYGLYVFHAACLWVSARLLLPWRSLASHETAYVLLSYWSGFVFTVAVAATSYRWFETPLLRLKQRWERVPSRAV